MVKTRISWCPTLRTWLMRTSIFAWFSACLSIYWLLLEKNYIVKKSDNTFIEAAKLTSPVTVKWTLCASRFNIPEKDTTSLMLYSSQGCITKSHEETLDKYKFRHSQQNNWLVFFKKCPCLERQSLRTYFKLKEIEEKWQLNANYMILDCRRGTL